MIPAANAAANIGTLSLRRTVKHAVGAKGPDHAHRYDIRPQGRQSAVGQQQGLKQQGDAGHDDRRAGPISKAPRPVPQGCEQVPIQGMGMGMHEMTKIAAPTIATRVMARGSSGRRRSMVRSPQIHEGRRHQEPEARPTDRQDSFEMCMAWAGVGHRRRPAMIDQNPSVFPYRSFASVARALTAAAATGLPPRGLVLVMNKDRFPTTPVSIPWRPRSPRAARRPGPDEGRRCGPAP